MASTKNTKRTPPDTTVGDGKSGAHPRLSLIVVGDDYFASHPLPNEGLVSVGRGKSCDVTIDDGSVSRTHLVLHVGDTLEVEDKSSVNGTRVRDRALEPDKPVTISPDEVVRLGAVSLIVQRRYSPPTARRLWSHEYFEGRLAEECARGERKDLEFAVVHVALDGETDGQSVADVFADVLRTLDIMSMFGPSQYELLLLDTSADQTEAILARLRDAFADRAVSASIGCARYPLDGRSADGLTSVARRAVRPAPSTAEQLLGEYIIKDERMRELHRLVARVAPGDISVLLMGETGVGKEILAEAIHRQSNRSDKPFLRLNCAALSESLLSSELFGHTRGSFTGATADKPGLLETAEGGTVFLDEIGELPLTIQVKLLRVLEERKVLRVGGLSPTSIDVRFVSATNRDLEADIERGLFRSDLFYRLNGIAIVIPPLRERTAEIAPLARKFIEQVAEKPVPTITPRALAALEAYSWPGNIRELRNTIERAALLCGGRRIDVEHLPTEKVRVAAEIQAPKPERPGREATEPTTERDNPLYLKTDRASVIAALEQSEGNQTKAAKLLGISRRTLVNRLDEYGLPRPRKGRIKR